MQQAGGAPQVCSSKAPPPHVLVKAALWGMCCLCSAWMLFFSALLVLLWHSHTKAVLEECGSFWDVMLLCIMSPPLVPFLYASASAFGTPWHSFVGFGALALFAVSLASGVQAASQVECVVALRASTPPLPWLLYAAWLKSVVFGSSAYSLLRG
jgi:hypothetical protein